MTKKSDNPVPPHSGDMPKLAAALAAQVLAKNVEPSENKEDGTEALTGEATVGDFGEFETEDDVYLLHGRVSGTERLIALTADRLHRIEQAQALPEVDGDAWCESATEDQAEFTSFKDADRRTMHIVVMRNGELAKQEVKREFA